VNWIYMGSGFLGGVVSFVWGKILCGDRVCGRGWKNVYWVGCLVGVDCVGWAGVSFWVIERSGIWEGSGVVGRGRSWGKCGKFCWEVGQALGELWRDFDMGV